MTENTATASTAEKLNAYLQQTKMVAVEDSRCEVWNFEIRRISMFIWDPGDWAKRWLDAGDEGTSEAMLTQIRERVGAPTDAILKSALVAAVKAPEISMVAKAGAVLVDNIVANDILVRNLYTEIVNFSFENILKAKG